jgi:hypothetical protein
MDGPYTKTVGDVLSNHFERRTWYRQPWPRKEPLPFQMRSLSISGSKTLYPNAAAASPDPDDLTYRRAYAKAYGDYTDAVKGEVTQLMTDFMERASAVDMIHGRTRQLLSFANNLRKGQVFKALRGLGTPAPAARKAERHVVSRSLANQWLELHFGWVPLVQDIYAAIDILQSQSNAKSAVAKRGQGDSRHLVQGSTSWPIFVETNVETYVGIRLASQIWIENPNLYRANQLGLTNPASWLFESVPFSFVLDWFTNASQFLTAWDTHIGVVVTGAHTTSFSRNLYASVHKAGSSWNPNYSIPGPDWALGVGVNRTLGISNPAFVIKAFKAFSAVRAATAMSLLVQMLPR